MAVFTDPDKNPSPPRESAGGLRRVRAERAGSVPQQSYGPEAHRKTPGPRAVTHRSNPMKEYNLNSIHLGSVLAQVGILGVAVVSATMNFHFWQARGDLGAAWLTLGAECVAVGGFVMVLHHWRDRRLTALGGLLVTLLSGSWGALTMTERLSDEAHQRAVTTVEATPAFAQAERDLALASSLYGATLGEHIPESLGPLTTEARSLDRQRRVEALKLERDQAQARVADLTPEPTLDAKSTLRGWGAMLAVLLGLSVFGFRGREETAAAQPNDDAAEGKVIRLTASELGKLGAAAKKAKREQAEQARLARNAYMRDYRARKNGKAPQPLWTDELFGQLPN